MTNAPAFALSASQVALLAHFEAVNAERKAWVAEDPDNRWTTTIPTDLAYLANLESEGVASVEEWEHESLAEAHYDYYKDVHGISPRWMDYKSMSIEDLKKEMDFLAGEAKEQEEFWESQAENRRFMEMEMEYSDDDYYESEKYQFVGAYDEYDPRYYGQITKELPRKW